MAKGKGHNRGPTQVHGMKGRVLKDQPAHTSEPELRQFEGATSARLPLWSRAKSKAVERGDHVIAPSDPQPPPRHRGLVGRELQP